MSLNETANFLIQQGFEKYVPASMQPLIGMIIKPTMYTDDKTPEQIEQFFRDIMQTVMYAMDDEIPLETFEKHVGLVILKYKK